ncbi:reverse transcriptase [Microseira wollei NIES-4236]|uniref:Reverse transcriptase n=2 Tax=Microseira wollei TaxID=467598 RepID=A0AAV3XJP3_9CYAN|nr:reverse transcriptase [Microseira wollei NIES-4236]
MGKNPQMPKRTASLLKQQKGKCAYCGQYFKDGDVIELDHIIPKSKGGKDKYKNWQLIHRHCHDTKTATDSSSGTKYGGNSTEPKSASKKPKPLTKNQIDDNEVWRKGVKGEPMTPEQRKRFDMLTY